MKRGDLIDWIAVAVLDGDHAPCTVFKADLHSGCHLV